MTTGDIPSPDTPGLPDELEKEARALAERHGLSVPRVLAVVQRGVELGSRHGGGMSHAFLAMLQGAMYLLPPARALEIFEREDPLLLRANIGIPEYLISEDTPFHTTAELSDLVGEFRTFLRQHQVRILETGDPHAEFSESRWLHWSLSRLYYLRVPAAESTGGEPAPLGRDLDVWQQRETAGERAHDRDTMRLKLDRKDADRLVSGRGKLLTLKLAVLAQLEDALRRGSPDELWLGCFDLMAAALTPEDVSFYLRMDRFYRGDDAERQGLCDEPSPVRLAAPPGGLTDVLEFMGRCECELRFGAMDQTKSAVVALARQCGPADWREVLGRTYYDVLDQPWRPQLDEIFARYTERRIAMALSGFWGEFRDRLRGAIADRWLWTPDHWPSMREEIERAVARIVRDSGGDRGGMAELSDADIAKHSGLAGSRDLADGNIFRKQGDTWLTRFAGTEKPLRDLKGMRYLGYLLEHPGEDIDVIDLVHEIQPPEPNGMGRASVAIGRKAAAAEGFVRDAFGHGGKMAGRKTLREYKRKLQMLQAEREDAEEQADRARLSAIDETTASIEAEINAIRRPGGGIRNVPGPGAKARDAVKKCIAAAKRVIKKENPALYEHLKASLTIGYVCSYRPITHVEWNR